MAEATEASTAVGEKLVEGLTSILKLEEAKKSLDPSGAMVPPPFVEKELEAFKERWASGTDNGKGLEAKEASYMAKFEQELEEVKELLQSSVRDDRPDKSKFEGLSPEDVKKMDAEDPVLHKLAEDELLTFARKFEGKHEVDLDIHSLGFRDSLLRAAGIEPQVHEEASQAGDDETFDEEPDQEEAFDQEPSEKKE